MRGMALFEYMARFATETAFGMRCACGAQVRWVLAMLNACAGSSGLARSAIISRQHEQVQRRMSALLPICHARGSGMRGGKTPEVDMAVCTLRPSQDSAGLGSATSGIVAIQHNIEPTVNDVQQVQGRHGEKRALCRGIRRLSA
jgi:hypothetical protein